MIVIDAKNLILGRFSTYAAKQALLGEEVRVINCEKAIVSGKKASSIRETQETALRGTPAKGPFIPKMADRYVRRVIRGMLPYKVHKGAVAYKRVLCYVGEPEEFKGKAITLESASFKKLPNLRFITIGEMIQNI